MSIAHVEVSKLCFETYSVFHMILGTPSCTRCSEHTRFLYYELAVVMLIKLVESYKMSKGYRHSSWELLMRRAIRLTTSAQTRSVAWSAGARIVRCTSRSFASMGRTAATLDIGTFGTRVDVNVGWRVVLHREADRSSAAASPRAHFQVQIASASAAKALETAMQRCREDILGMRYLSIDASRKGASVEMERPDYR
jgi:hypothetical protein